MQRFILSGSLGGCDPSIFATTLDPFVAILVQCSKVFPQFSVLWVHWPVVANLRKTQCQRSQSCRVKLVLVRLQIKRYVRYPKMKRRDGNSTRAYLQVT